MVLQGRKARLNQKVGRRVRNVEFRWKTASCLFFTYISEKYSVKRSSWSPNVYAAHDKLITL